MEAIWIGGPAGTWSEPANWSTGVVPNLSTTDVAIDSDPLLDSTVILDQTVTIQNTVIDLGDTLNIDTSRSLNVNSATITGSVNLGSSVQLMYRDYLWVQPSGTVSLGALSTVKGFSSFVPLWNQGQIKGAGTLGTNLSLFNEGIVSANVAAKPLTLHVTPNSSPVVNFNGGEIVAEAGGILNITSSIAVLNNSLNGVEGLIEARGDSTVNITGGVEVVGGVISTSSAGGTNEGVVILNTGVLKDVRLEGNVRFDRAFIEGRIENNTQQATTSLPQRVYVTGEAILTGTGRLDLRGGELQTGNSGSYQGLGHLINDAEHTIAGPGRINTSAGSPSGQIILTNRGLIENAEQTLEVSLRQGDYSSNSGVMRALGGGILQINGSNFFGLSASTYALNNFADNTDGLIEAGLDSTVSLSRVIVRGGVLRSVMPEGEVPGVAGKIVSSPDAFTALRDLRLEGPIGDATSSWRLIGGIENTGELRGTRLVVMAPTVLTGGGQVRISQEVVGDTSGSSGQYYQTLVNEDNVMGGHGTIGGPSLAVINRGIIQADESNNSLLLAGPGQIGAAVGSVNRGTLRAINGGTLNLDYVINREGNMLGTIHAGDDSEVRIGLVEGGIFSTEGTGRVIVNGGYVAGVHNQGTLNVQGSSRFAGTFRNDGAVAHSSPYTVTFDSPLASITGIGVWGEGAAVMELRIGGFQPTLFMHGPDHTIQGRGDIHLYNGTFINQGTIVANGNSPLRITLDPATTMSQRGTLRSISSVGMELSINDDRFTNRGLIEATGSFALKRLNAGPVELVNSPGAQIDMRSTLSVSAPQSPPTDSVSVWNQEGALFTGSGKLNVIQTGLNSSGLFRNSGILRPDSNAFASGRIFLDGNFLQESTGRLELDLSGAPDTGLFDYLRITHGNATLGGALDISLASGFDPAVGDSFEILTVTNGIVNEGFDTFSAPALAGRWWSLEYQADKVLLNIAAITADFDGNGIVDGDDLDEWQTAYTLGNNAADADNDGDSDGRDFLAWQRQFGSGVELPAASVTVPEPAGLTLGFLGLTKLLWPNRRQRSPRCGSRI